MSDLLKTTQQILQRKVDEKKRKEEREEDMGFLSLLLSDAVEKLGNIVSGIKITPPSVTVEPTQVSVPEIKVPEIKIPEIKVPEAKVTVSVPEIKIPKIEVPKIPPIKVPKPEVTVNVPAIKIPKIEMPSEMNISGDVGLRDIDLGRPLPVQLRDKDGRPVSLDGGSSSSGGARIVGIKAKDGGNINPATEESLAELYTKLIAYDASSNPIYTGFAAPGSATSAAVWRIKKITYDASDNPTAVEWPNGDTEFKYIWDNRASLTYS